MSARQKVLDVNVPQQAQDNWCWAAVSVGIRRAYERAATLQCDVARRVLGRVCCPAGTNGGCNVQRTLAPALLPYLEGPVLADDASRTFEFVKQQIDRGRPIAVRIAWSEAGSGHFVVISGYLDDGDVQDVFVCDPFVGGHGIPWSFEQFHSNYHGLGRWDLTFRTTPVNGAPVPEVDNGNLSQ